MTDFPSRKFEPFTRYHEPYVCSFALVFSKHASWVHFGAHSVLLGGTFHLETQIATYKMLTKKRPNERCQEPTGSIPDASQADAFVKVPRKASG
jgi:hypothetical protein